MHRTERRIAVCFSLLCVFTVHGSDATLKPSAEDAKAADYSKESFVFEQAFTKVVFENDGTYSMEATARVRIQSQAGVQQFGMLNFPYASATGTMDVVYVRAIKADNRVVETPAENVLDMPADITRQAPFYSDLKEKQVAVKGLEIGDTIEYQSRNVVKSPLDPGQFWFAFNFFQAGICLREELQISVPRDRYIKVESPKLQPTTTEQGAYRTYTWETANLESNAEKKDSKSTEPEEPARPSVQITTFRDWDDVGQWFRSLVAPRAVPTPQIQAKADELTRNAKTDPEKIQAIYDYVSTKFRYIGISLGIGRYQPHAAADVLNNGYGDCKDKHTLLAALLAAAGFKAYPAVINSSGKIDPDMPAPSQFDHMITVVPQGKDLLWLDTTQEVAPFGFLTANLRDKQALVIADSGPAQLVKTPADPPFESSFIFHIDGKLNHEGTLEAKVETSVRGDLEVAMRAAFRRAPQPQWKDVVQAISSSWNFAGDVSDAIVSSPEATDEPFNFKYAYTRKDYPDFPDVIRPPLPTLNLAQLSDDAGKGSEPIHLGSPGRYLVNAKIELPGDLRPRLAAAVDIKRDFAEYHASYSWASGVLHAERRMRVNMREIPRTRSGEYRSFWKAVNDEQESLMSLSSSSPPSISEKGGASPGELSADADAERFAALGAALFKENDLDGAIAEYRKALRLKPNDPSAHRNLGVALKDKGDLDGAIAEYHTALQLEPNGADAHRDLGVALKRKGDLDGAIAEYRVALRLKPNDVTAHYNLGNALMRKGDLDGAITEYRAALRLDPNGAEAHGNLGNALSGKGDLEGAIAEYRAVLQSNPNDAKAQHNLGVMLVDKGDLEGAIAEYRAAAQLNPTDAEAHMDLGAALATKGDLDGAIAEFRVAAQLKPTDAEAHTDLGTVLAGKGDLGGALAEYREALRLKPDDSEAHCGLGDYLFFKHDLDGALAEYREALRLKPDLFLAHFHLGGTLLKMKRYSEAVAELEAASKGDPDRAKVLLQLGDAYVHSGNKEKAIATIQEAVGKERTPAILNGGAYVLADNNLQLNDALQYAKKAVDDVQDDTVHITLDDLSLKDIQTVPSLAAYWGTLGWVNFRLGALDQAEKFLYAGWSLTQDSVIGDHLRQVYEKQGKKREVTRDPLVLQQFRTVKLGKLATKHVSAEFFMLFAPGPKVVDVKFISGSDELRGAGKTLAAAKFTVIFPEDGPVQILRRGVLDCEPELPGCMFVLFPPSSVHSVK